MQICQTHWDMLRQAMEDRGLAHLIGAESAKAQIEGELDGVPADERPRDPLMSANFSIMGNAMQMGGLYMMMGDYCPICEVVKHTAGVWKNPQTDEVMDATQVERWWIDGPADAELQAARERGSVPGAQ